MTGPKTNEGGTVAGERIGTRATAKYLRGSATKARQVLDLIVAGQSNKEIARSLSLGEGTVKIHVATLLRVLGVPNRSAAAAWAGANLVRLRPAAAGR